MTINLSIPKEFADLKPRITVVGVGGAGGNAVNNMIRANLVGCEFIACNTDAQALQHSLADRRIQLGQSATLGLGAGSRPEVGRQAAEEVLDEIMEHLGGSHMVFITAGMGGGTGTGAAPVIARAAREAGILTVGVVTKPFHFEGTHRMRLAESGIEELQKFVDTLLIIPNQNLFRVANERTTFADAFKMADDVLHSGVRGVTDLMVMPGLINLDFADIRAVMNEMGKAMMGTGEASGEKRALDAAEAAISNPLLDDVSMKGARGVLINITGGMDMTLFEVDEAANRIREEVDPEANIIFGSTFDEKLEGRIRISVVATGIDAEVSKAAAAAEHARRIGPVLVQNNPAPQAAAVGQTPATGAVAQPEQVPLPNFINRMAQPDAVAETRAGEPAVAAGGETAAAEPRRAAAAEDGSFLPPRPESVPEPAVSETYGARPIAQPPARTASKPFSMPSLINKIIGAGRSSPPAQPRQAPTMQPPRTAPHAPPQSPVPPTAGPRADAVPQAGRQEPGAAALGHQDSYLDIPAFLRRQAN